LLNAALERNDTERDKAEDDGMIPMNKEPGTELNSAFLENKEREDWKRLNQKFSNGKQQEKKRDEKEAKKEKVKQDKLETQS
jgi:hypothetical protein